MKDNQLFAAFLGLFLLVICFIFLATFINGLKSVIVLLAITLAVDYIIAFFALCLEDNEEETNEDTNN